MAALCRFVQLQEMQLIHAIVDTGQCKTQWLAQVVTAFVTGFIVGKERLQSQFRAVINAQVINRMSDAFFYPRAASGRAGAAIDRAAFLNAGAAANSGAAFYCSPRSGLRRRRRLALPADPA